MSNIQDILVERGRRYGEFPRHAEISQKIQDVVRLYGPALKAYQAEALMMIAHKMGRILNGDPDYADSWQDIAGYAQLVVNELNRKDEIRISGGGSVVAQSPDAIQLYGSEYKK